MKKISAVLLLVSGFLLAAKPASAAKYLNLKLPGITGTSTVPGHVGEIPVYSFSAGVSAKKGAGSSCSDLAVFKNVDQTSPLLFATTMAGIDFAQATLTYSEDSVPPGSILDVYVLKLNNASITSVQDSGSSEIPTESVSIKATSWVSTFTPSVGPPITTTVTCK